jgi:hypothetical protein
MRFGAPIVVVSGLPRSGTSMAMKMLDAGGMRVVADGIREADIDNPKGYYEDERVKDLAEMDDKSWLRESRGRVIKIISFLLFHLPPDNNYKIIFMRRDLEEVLASQSKMLANRDESTDTDDQRMRQVYESHLWRVNYLLKHNAHLEALEVPYTAVLDDPQGQAERINEFLGGGLDVAAMTTVADRKLYRNRAQSS